MFSHAVLFSYFFMLVWMRFCVANLLACVCVFACVHLQTSYWLVCDSLPCAGLHCLVVLFVGCCRLVVDVLFCAGFCCVDGVYPFMFCVLYSTSPPGGNQVDGLPPVRHIAPVVIGRPGSLAKIYDN